MTTRIDEQSRHGFKPIPMPATHEQLNERARGTDKSWVIGDMINQIVHNREGILNDRDRIIQIEQTVARLIHEFAQNLTKTHGPALAKEVIGIIKEDKEFLNYLFSAVIENQRESINKYEERLKELEVKVLELQKKARL